MVKLGVQPRVKRMARRAGRRKIGCRVVGILGFPVIRQMAGGTFCGQTLILSHSRALVTFLALNRRVRAEQWKTILVVLDLAYGNLPAQHGVALCAIRSEFSSVQVRVAIRAIPAHIRENGFHVACDAHHFFVHSAQRVVGLVVVEFRNGANRAPCCRRVTILAGYGKRAVRTLRVALLREKTRDEQNQPEREQQPDADLWYA